jgi:hypothetical protein
VKNWVPLALGRRMFRPWLHHRVSTLGRLGSSRTGRSAGSNLTQPLQ